MALGRGVEVCAEAGDTEQGIRAAKLQQPGVCLVGREIPGDARRAVRGICRAAPGTAVVVLSAERDVDDLLEMVRAGATGYYPGPVEAERLSTIIRAVAANEAVVPRSLVLELMLELRDRDGLTGRESQVLGLLRRGNTTADISRRLQIAPVTVRRYISELVHKLGVQDRRSLIGPAVGPARGQSKPTGASVSAEVI